ncbi:endonuclease/exonuclease/phosphatase family protein [Streptomyces sp. NPDC052051]|uniref:endonuclease/exonuclease/phosphatase family protein n=1 Tax=Streptomyces sp. NPDC052051 TaxID=3154649 RepID=UPI003448C0EE
METATAQGTEPTATGHRSRGRTVAAWFAGVLLTGVSAVVGCRAADTDAISPVPQLLAFLPWLIAPVGVALLFALLARWRTGLVWGVLVLAPLAWFMEPYGKSDEPTGTPLAEFRVLTSNVQYGRGTAALVTAIRRERPDIVFVEECEHHCSATLRQAFGGPDGVYRYRQAVEGAGSDGSVLLSRFPLKAASGVPGTMGMPGAVADVRGHRVRLQLAHPMPPLMGQLTLWRRELGALRSYATAGGDTPTILAGDFNASQDHAEFRRILDTGLHDSARLADRARTPSWPARVPSPLGVQIDHALVSREDFSVNSARFLDIADTDHRALLVDLTLRQRG